MPRYIKKIWSGDVYEAEEYYSRRKINKSSLRGPNENGSSAEQQERNLKYARKKLARKINANFGKGDLFLTLTHKQYVGYGEAKRQLQNFLKRLKRKRKKMGLPELKYVAVTEAEDKRAHHHLVVSGTDLTVDQWTELWGQGRIMISRLEPDGDYTGLTRYITKECPLDHSKRWSCSRNLVEPKVEVVPMKDEKPKQRLRVPKGYREVERYEYASEENGMFRYIKAIRNGGADYGEGKEQES